MNTLAPARRGLSGEALRETRRIGHLLKAAGAGLAQVEAPLTELRTLDLGTAGQRALGRRLPGGGPHGTLELLTTVNLQLRIAHEDTNHLIALVEQDLRGTPAEDSGLVRALEGLLVLARALDARLREDLLVVHRLFRAVETAVVRDLSPAYETARALLGGFPDAWVLGAGLHRRLADQAATFSAQDPAGPPPRNAATGVPAARAVAAARPAEKLIDVELRLLPPAHRARYAEEFHAELHHLARTGATPAGQSRYALRQLRGVWRLRAALKEPLRPRWFRLHRLACWVLGSEWRTWGVLGPPLLLAIGNVFLQQGWGSAVFTIPGVVVYWAGVEKLRERWGVRVRRRGVDQ
ncbi:hypothetical protein [Nonomuraea sp. NPDC049758]|uniref:hypothetical protein n=1 Tax=Nonomuraea sp. NPDC049758 TaxID=3154360 RepID=UPI003448D99F